MSATIIFSNGTSLKVHENDSLTPVILGTDEHSKPIAQVSDPVVLYSHVHKGLTIDILTVAYICDYFYFNDDFSTVYVTKTIVSVVAE